MLLNLINYTPNNNPTTTNTFQVSQIDTISNSNIIWILLGFTYHAMFGVQTLPLAIWSRDIVLKSEANNCESVSNDDSN